MNSLGDKLFSGDAFALQSFRLGTASLHDRAHAALPSRGDSRPIPPVPTPSVFASKGDARELTTLAAAVRLLALARVLY